MQIDRDGLQVAFLDESGQIDYFLDAHTGEVVEVRPGDSRHGIDSAPDRFLRVPSRTAETEAEDRWAFVSTIEDEELHQQLSVAAGDNRRFRLAVAADRTVERAWYSFKNDRATAAIEGWLEANGLP